MFGLFGKKGPFKVNVNSGSEVFEVPVKDNLLKAALANKIAWPNNCRVGSCGQCKCKLVNGKIKPLNDFSYVLNAEELDSGMILACQTSLRSDIEVEVVIDKPPQELSQAKQINGKILSSTNLTKDILEVKVRLDEAMPTYLAGQYAELTIPGVISNPRCYSFAYAPHKEKNNEVSFYIRHVPNGQLTTWLHLTSRVNESVTINGPFGSFWLRDSSAPIICMAGGSGMAPIKALLEQIEHEGFNRKVTYIFGARGQEDLYCLDEMKALQDKSNGNFEFIPILSREPDDSSWVGLRGQCPDYLLPESYDLPNSHVYLCGPPGMIDSAIAILTKHGTPSKNIYYDKFIDASHMPGGR